MGKTLYFYKAFVKKVYDGDTITVDIDLGLKTFVHGEKIRLFGINAPEMRGKEKPEGTIARDFLREQILGKEILIQTIEDKKGKFGRYLGVIWLKKAKRHVNINELLVRKGYAVKKEY